MVEQNSSSEMAQLLAQSLPGKPPRIGEMVEAEVISVDAQGILVNVGMKTEGLVPAEEMRSLSQEERGRLQTGDRISAIMLGNEGQEGMVFLSVDKAQAELKWRDLERHCREGTEVTARVVAYNKGGLVVEYRGIQGFVPFSQAIPLPRGAEKESILESRIGQEAPFHVLEVDRARERLVMSERAIWQRQREESQSRALAALEVGSIVSGKVTSIRGFGAFVDLGEVDGLIPLGELSWGRIKGPGDVVKVGQQVTVKVLQVEPESRRVTLSLRQTEPEPWETVHQRYHEGQRVKGTVTRLTDFGAFVALEDGIDGLVHISELSWKAVVSPSDVVQVGDVIDVVVLKVDQESRRISLSYKRTQPEPWDLVPAKYRVGEVVQGVVTRLADFGAFVELEEGIEGLIHISELSPRQVSDPAECVHVRQKVQVKVLNVDTRARRISLSYKQAFGY